MAINIAVSTISTAISLLFMLLVFRQYLQRRRPYQLIWSLALLLWGIGVGSELIATLRGWAPLVYRIYYASGALLVPAWLGLGTFYLLAPQRYARWAVVLLSLVSLLGIGLILTWPIPDPTVLQQAGQFVPVKVFPFIPVRLLLVVLNVLGTVAFVGGALYSAWGYWRRQIQPEYLIGTLLIAAGGLVAAGAHSLGAIGWLELFRIGQLVAVILIFSGFLWTMRRPAARSATAPG